MTDPSNSYSTARTFLEGHAAADGWDDSHPVIERAFRAAEDAEITLDIHPNFALYRPASPHPPAPPLHTPAEAVRPSTERVTVHHQEPAESVEVKSPHRWVRHRLGES